MIGEIDVIGYTVNFECSNFQKISIEEAAKLASETIVILLNSSCNDKLRDYYTSIRKMLIKANSVVVVDDNSSITNQIGMLMCLYENYGIYRATGNSLNEDYITSLISREPTIQEVETFVNADLAGYAELNNIILDLMNAVKAKDVNKITEVLSEKIDEIENFVGLIDYLRTMTNDTVEGKINSKNLSEEINKLKSEVEQKDSEIETLRGEILTNRKSNTEYKAEIIKLNDKIVKLSEAEPYLMAYNELNTKLLSCKVKSVIYFKEISPISYINSFVVTLVETLRKLRRLNVKFIIYDNKHAFLNAYRPPFQLITSNDYGSDRARVVTNIKDMLLTEVNQAILQDVIQDSKWDVVVIYDKLKQANDIIAGNIVSKYYVLNSLKEFNVIEREYGAKEENVITRVGVIPGGLTITYSQECENAKDENSKKSAHMAFYCMKMMNVGQQKGKVFDIILNRANIQSIPQRVQK